MPEIGRLGGTKVLMFFHDENPPHIHIKGTDFAAKLRISNGDVIAGSAPGRVLKLARRWLNEHRSELLALWQGFQK
jgi:hypothetical protein